MKNIHKSILGIVGGVIGTAFGGILFLTMSSVFAAPTQSPPNGNPTFPLQGPQGTFGTCRLRTANCTSPAFGGCSTTATVSGGWTMTGGECGATPGAVSLMDSTVGATSGSVSCTCHDFQFPQAGTCTAYLWECQN